MLIALFITSMILAFTSIGFPYSDAAPNPRLQRFRFMHTKRTFYDHNGDESSSENGFMLSATDRNAVRTLESCFDPNMLIDWEDDPKCQEVAYCAFPINRFNKGRYLKGSFDAPTMNQTEFTVHKVVRDVNDPANVLIEFELKLTILTFVYITPGEGWSFVTGSLPTSERTWRGKNIQYTRITYGKATDEVMTETITMKVNV